jgi:hypothetical protein
MPAGRPARRSLVDPLLIEPDYSSGYVAGIPAGRVGTRPAAGTRSPARNPRPSLSPQPWRFDLNSYAMAVPRRDAAPSGSGKDLRGANGRVAADGRRRAGHADSRRGLRDGGYDAPGRAIAGSGGSVLEIDEDREDLAVAAQRAQAAGLRNVSFKRARVPDELGAVLDEPVDRPQGPQPTPAISCSRSSAMPGFRCPSWPQWPRLGRP